MSKKRYQIAAFLIVALDFLVLSINMQITRSTQMFLGINTPDQSYSYETWKYLPRECWIIFGIVFAIAIYIGKLKEEEED